MIKKTSHAKQRAVSSFDKAIGEKVRARRLEMHMSQDELGRALDISFQQIQKYEKGVNRIAAGRLMQIASTLGTSTHYFLGDIDKPKTNGELAFAKFMASRDGVAIIEAMIAIKPALRLKVIEIARNLAG